MRKLFIVTCIGWLSLRTQAQNIKRMKIAELVSYIRECDHPLIVNFWATYCAPCNTEIPYFQTTVGKFKDDGVELLLVSLDRPDHYPDKIAAFAEEHGYNMPIAWLDETDPRYFCIKIDKRWSGGMPSSLLINNENHYRRFFDRQLTAPQVGPAIGDMLAPAP